MAFKKAGGSSKNGRQSQRKRLGVKVFGGQKIGTGQIVLRQKGTKFFPGKNAGLGKDFTIFAKANGVVHFSNLNNKKYVNIIPNEDM